MSSLGIDPTALLRADGRLRRLARELVRDVEQAEDDLNGDESEDQGDDDEE